MMLAAERRDEILARLGRDGRVVVAELVAGLSVSEDTIRRDLQGLGAMGLLQRVHGGALPAPQEALPFERRLEIGQKEKRALALAAVPLVASARTLVLDGGTTAVELASRLPSGWDGTIVTNAPPIAAALAGHPAAEVVVVGGRLLKEEQVTVGPAAVDAFRALRADVCVLGVCALDPVVGATTVDGEEAHVKRAMVGCSRKVVALVTSDKLHTSYPWVVAAIEEIDDLVTDGAKVLTNAFALSGVNVVAV
jgi:DeoR/GlpR family transcriptional regulator of sugar metabolism